MSYQENGGDVGTGGNARGTQFGVGDSVPLNPLGQEIWEEAFTLVFPFSLLFTSSRIWGGLGGGVPLFFHVEKFRFLLSIDFSGKRF